MKILWISGLPEEVRRKFGLTDVPCAAWSWVIGALPPPERVKLHVLCPVFGMKEPVRHFEYGGASWHCFRLKRWEPLFLRRRFTRQIRPFVRELDPDVIHGWGGESGCGLVATYLTRQALVSVQGLLRMLEAGRRDYGVGCGAVERGLAYRLRRIMEAMTYRRAHRLICESKTARTWLKRCYGKEATIVPYPLRTEFLDSFPIDRANNGGHELRLLFIGQDVPRKGYSDAVRACEGIATLHKAEGKNAKELVELMQSADAMIVPSYGDTGPTALKEALSQGLYPIVYDNTGAAELVRHYGYGTVVPTGDVQTLRKAVESIRRIDVGNSRAVATRIRADLNRARAWVHFLDAYARRGFSQPPEDQLRGAMGVRIGHFAKMLAGLERTNRVVISFQTGVRQNLLAAIAAKLSGRKVVREINEWPLSATWGESKIKQWVEVHVLPKFFDGFICISDVLVDFCRQHGRPGVPILKLPMTVDCEAIDAVAAKDAALRRKLVVYAGSMTELKDGVESLRQAFDLIRSKYAADLEFVHDLPHDEAVAIMKSAACLVLARPDSQQARAGFPTKLGEYLATGVPVVVTKTGEIPRYLQDGVNAFLAEPGDIKGIADKISLVLSDGEKAARVGAEGRKVAERCFDWHNHAEALNTWLRQFI